MSKTVLFSPVGMSDPVRGNYDGPFLHIIRYMKPDRVYIFFTKETWKFHLKDNRYIIMAKKICPDCEYIPLDYSLIDNPSDYKIVDRALKEAVARMMNDIDNLTEETDILINVTSGTTQMNSSLYIHAASSRRKLKLVSVATYKGGANREATVGEKYDIEQEWKENLDNSISDPEIINRCKIIEPDNVRYQIAVENIISHIKVYDYSAALSVTLNSAMLFENRIIKLLEAGEKRIRLFYNEAFELARIHGYKFESLPTVRERDIFEYLLYLQILCSRNEISDFSRAVSPVLTELALAFLKNVYNFDFLEKFCVVRKIYNVVTYKVDRNKIEESGFIKYYDNYFQNKNEITFKDSYLAYSNIIPMIEYFAGRENNTGSDGPAKVAAEKALELREFEKCVRNIEAHQINGVTDDLLKRDYGYNSKYIFSNLKYLFGKAFPRYEKNAPWDSYDRFNAYLEKRLFE